MVYLLDSNACIVHLRSAGSSALSRRIRSAQAGKIVICSVVVSELYFGAHRSQRVAANLKEIDAFVAGFQSVPFDTLAAVENARVRADLEAKGQRVGPFDSLIAAIAIVNGLTLVTHNVREFSRIPQLNYDDWQ